MTKEKTRPGFKLFAERYFGNFHRVVLTNLMFAVPSAAVFTLLYFIGGVLFGDFSAAFLMLAIIPLYPFYAGVVMVMRDIARGDRDVRVAATFFKAVKENFLPFLLHGFVVCAAALISFASLSLYISMLSVSAIFYIILFFCVIITLLLLYASFYLPLLTVTYDLKLRYIYKNSLLMSFGEIVNNLLATLAIALVMLIFLSVVIFSRSVIMLVIVLAALWALFLPATFTFCYCFFTYNGMAHVMSRKSEIASAGEKGSQPKPEREDKLSADDFSDIDISKLRDTDDFIFHNGRMIRQSALLKLLRERESKEGEQDE